MAPRRVAASVALLLAASLRLVQASRVGEPFQASTAAARDPIADAWELDGDGGDLDRKPAAFVDARLDDVDQALGLWKLFHATGISGAAPLEAAGVAPEGREEVEEEKGHVEGREDADGDEEGRDALADMFRALDDDGDGKISLDALVEAARAEGEPGLEGLVEALLAVADADRDGALDRAEAERFMELLAERLPDAEDAEMPSGDEAVDLDFPAALADLLVADTDGGLSLRRLVDAAEASATPERVLGDLVRRFAGADADADGRLEAEEAETFLRRLRGHRAAESVALVDGADADEAEEADEEDEDDDDEEEPEVAGDPEAEPAEDRVMLKELEAEEAQEARGDGEDDEIARLQAEA